MRSQGLKRVTMVLLLLAAPTVAARADEVSETLARGDEAFGRGQYELAISGLEGYVRTFPRSEQAGEAQALVGNSYFQLGKYDQAVEAYDLAIRTYPRSPSIPEAQYKRGRSLQSLKQNDAAREAYEAVIKTYPDSPEATLAKQGLDSLTLAGTRKP